MKKQEFRTKTRIFSLLLSGCISFSGLPVNVFAQESVDITYYQLDLSDKFNFSNWGILGETITSDTFVSDTRASLLFPKGGSTVDTFKLNEDITFKFDTATYSANVNNYYIAAKNETAVFEGHESFAKTVYMGIALYGQSSGTISAVINYTDGTSETKNVYIKNKTQLNNAAELPANYVGAIDMSKNTMGNVGYRKAVNNEGVVGEASSTDGIAFYKIDVDSTKEIDNISIKNTETTQVGYYAIGGSVMSNSELLTYVNEAQAFDGVTSENADTIKIAKGYADELIERNAVTAKDVEKINTLYEDVTWYEDKIDSKQNMLNLSEQLNMDMLAPLGSSVDEYFDEGFTFTYTDMWKKYTANGIISAVLDDESVIDFSMDETKYEAGKKDAVYLKAGETTVTIPSVGEPSEKVYFIWGSRGDNRKAKVTVNYSDGSSQEETVSIYRFSSRDSAPAKVGSLMFNWNTYYPVLDEATGKYVITSKSETAGINIYSVALDTTKTPVSYTIKAADDYDTAIFAMTETTMSNADMIAVIDSVKKLDLVRTEEDAKNVELAWNYAKELDRRHAVKLEDNADIKALVKQADAQKDIYVDITSVLDTDLIVNTGDSRPSDYSGRDDALYKVMGGKVTLISPRNSDYTDADSGRTFILNGRYDGNGNDSVKAGVRSVKIDIADKLLSRISVLVDCIDTNVSRNNGADVKAVITYNDGTKEEVKGQTRRSDTWYTNQYGAFADIEYAHYDSETGKYADGRLSVEDEGDKYCLLSSFGFNIPTAKKVSEIEFCGDMGYTYHILGLTAVPLTNTELEENLAGFENIAGASDVNTSNAKTALLAASSILELYERGYDLDSDSLALAYEVYAAACVYLADGEVLEFNPSLTVEGTVATLNAIMSNTTSKDVPYVLIIAAYDSNNELAGVIASETKTLSASSVAVKDKLTMEKTPDDAVKYKAMIWDGLDTMHPYEVAEVNPE